MRITWIDKNEVAGGGIPISIENAESLHAQGIRAIVTLTEHPLTTQKVFSGSTLSDMGFEVLHVPVVDQFEPTVEQVK